MFLLFKGRGRVFTIIGVLVLGFAIAWMAQSVTEATESARGSNTVGICHRTGTIGHPFVFIRVSPASVPAQRAHGDIIGVSSPSECEFGTHTPTPTFNPYPPPGTPTPTFNPYPPPSTPTPTP